MSDAPPCPLCASAAPKVFLRERRGYRLYDCPDCGLGFCAPFKNPGPEYYEHNTDVYSVVLEERPDPMSFEYGEGLALLRRELGPGARILDVGCGAGGFLHVARAAGFSASGLDFNAARVAALRAKGFDVFAGGLPDFARGTPPPFDAVTMFQVLEHVDDLGVWLGAARDVLRPGGLLIVCTPNRGRTFDPFQGPGLEDIDFPPHHLTRWSSDALSGALTRTGFQALECRPLGYPLPLFQLLLRNSLRFGLATRALNVDQLRNAPAPAAGGAGARQGLVKLLVAAKESILNAAALIAYPFFLLAYALFRWQGVVLFSAARKPR